MLDYARQRAVEVLRASRTAVLATSGPAGVQASKVSCEGLDLTVYILVPRVSDHLFNLENDPRVTLLTSAWELKGKAQVILADVSDLELNLVKEPGAEWCALVRVEPYQVHVRMETGWGNLETIDLKSY